MTTLTATAVHAGYRGREVLHGVDVAFDAGVHLVLGPNGAGKTTLFRTLVGVLAPSAGRVLVDGIDPNEDLGAKASIGVGAHRAALAPRLSVVDNLSYWAHVLALAPSVRDACVARAVDLLDLGPIATRRASELSRGQAQRVSLARALLADPQVLVLDEPFAGVDPGVGMQLRDHLRRLADDGRTVIVSTHELAEVSTLGDDVTVLHDGRVVGRGATDELRAALVGSRYRLRVRARGDLAGALGRLGYVPEAAQGGAVVVDVAGEDAVETLVAGLVAAGVGVREVTPAANPLEDLYRHLQADVEDGSPPRRAPSSDAA